MINCTITVNYVLALSYDNPKINLIVSRS